MKRLLINATEALAGILAFVVIEAWATGQPLTGFIKLEGLYKIFIKSAVPAWLFALILLFALAGIYYAYTHLPERLTKGKVHFVPDAHNCGWAKHTDSEMDVRIGGTFTYDQPSELIILKAFLRGTQPITDMLAQVDNEVGKNVTVSELWFAGSARVKAFLHLHLTPVIGKPGQPLKATLILHDKFNRDFPIGPIQLTYLGR